jgi:hypothetical protein
MQKPFRVILLVGLCAAIGASIVGCGKPGSVTLVPAPPGPTDLGPAIECGTPSTDAIVFDLKYVAQTGDPNEIQYHSYWGYGGSTAEARTNSFLQDVRQRVAGAYEVNNPSLPDRQWAAVEHSGRQASAFYFDLNADGKLADNERILPTRKEGEGIEFITPDFLQRSKAGAGGQLLCRVLLQVNFYGGSEHPNCMWSPAALLEGTATLNGQPARLLLFQNGPGGMFDRYGSSSYALLLGVQPKTEPRQYVPREILSSVIASDREFYRLTVDGRRSNGLPARMLLVKDTSPTGELAVKMTGSETLKSRLNTLSLHGVGDKTVFLRIGGSNSKTTLPVGTYRLNSGDATYGAKTVQDWEVSFSHGPNAEVKAGTVAEVLLGQPTLKIRTVEENHRHDPEAAESTSFKRGTRIYLEPRIAGKGDEVFSRFRQNPGSGRPTDRPPHVTITGPDGEQLVSKTMEYG